MPAGLWGNTVPAAADSASRSRAARNQPPGGAQRCSTSLTRTRPRFGKRVRRGAGRDRARVAVATVGSLKLAQVFGVPALRNCASSVLFGHQGTTFLRVNTQ